MGQIEQALKGLEQAGSKNADKLRENFHAATGTSEGGSSLIETDYDKTRTTEFLRELVRELKEQGHKATGKAPRKSPGGEQL